MVLPTWFGPRLSACHSAIVRTSKTLLDYIGSNQSTGPTVGNSVGRQGGSYGYGNGRVVAEPPRIAFEQPRC